MSLQNHYFQTAIQLLTNYNGAIPLHLFLKQFFSQHKKYGSRDRRNISGLCYHFFRLGKASMHLPLNERLVVALFLASREENPLLDSLHPGFNKQVHLSLEEKWKFAGLPYSINDIFPLGENLSSGIDSNAYAASFLLQPDVFIRIRPGKVQQVLQKLDELHWPYYSETLSAYRLSQGYALEKYFRINEDLVIQDLNSQRVGDFVKSTFDQFKFKPTSLWDCCAASGGKSIMLYDLFPGIKIKASDIRQSILYNLAKRFEEAGIENYQSFVADLSVKSPISKIKPLEFIVADVPCTGSGTWARTPEQLYFFDEKMMDVYASKQYDIASNALTYLLPGGWLVYITCSVFFKENEGVVNKLIKDNKVELVKQDLLDGTSQKCDSMFVAIIRKNLN